MGLWNKSGWVGLVVVALFVAAFFCPATAPIATAIVKGLAGKEEAPEAGDTVSATTYAYTMLVDDLDDADPDGYNQVTIEIGGPRLMQIQVYAYNKPFGFAVMRPGDEENYFSKQRGEPVDREPTVFFEHVNTTKVDLIDQRLEHGEWSLVVWGVSDPPEALSFKRRVRIKAIEGAEEIGLAPEVGEDVKANTTEYTLLVDETLAIEPGTLESEAVELTNDMYLEIKAYADGKPFDFMLVPDSEVQALVATGISDPLKWRPQTTIKKLGVTAVDLTDTTMPAGTWHFVFANRTKTPISLRIRVRMKAVRG